MEFGQCSGRHSGGDVGRHLGASRCSRCWQAGARDGTQGVAGGRCGWGSQASLKADEKETEATARNVSVRVPWNFSS
jgi:hypothetical protein